MCSSRGSAFQEILGSGASCLSGEIMNKEVAMLWIEAMESGNYSGTSVDVLLTLAEKAGIKNYREFIEWTKFSSNNPLFGGYFLSQIDKDNTLTQVAQIVRQEIRKLR